MGRLKASRLRWVLSASLTFLAIVPAAFGYAIEHGWWPRGSSFTMQLGFGSASIPLQDGMTSWDASAADAFDIWHGYLEYITASSVSSATVPQACDDGINSAFFSSTIFGDSFDEGTLAVTVIVSVEGDISETVEADVIVNNAFDYDSYRGSKQEEAYDFHRIMVHEFGHVFGLDHVTNDPPGQAIMEPVISDMDHPGPDDTAGISSLYRAFIYSVPPRVLLRVGDAYQYPTDELRANNDPSSFSVSGLPPGITYDPATRLISGTATTAGLYDSIVIAHGPFADAYAAIPFNVQGLERVRGLQKILEVGGAGMVADPIRPRIYAAWLDHVRMIDTETFAVTILSPSTGADVTVPNLSLSADSKQLLFTDRYQTPPILNRIDLETLALLPSLPIPGNLSAVLEGLEDRDFVADQSGVYQFDRSTGMTQTFFAPTGITGSGPTPEIALSPDLSTLFVTEYTSEGPEKRRLLVYDVSGSEPILIQSAQGDYRSPVPSPDGQFLYYDLGDSGGSGQLFQALLPDLNSATSIAMTTKTSQLATGPDGTIYESAKIEGPTHSSFSLYDPVSRKETFNIDLNKFYLDTFNPFVPTTGVFDPSGRYLYVATYGLVPEVWVFSTDFAAYPEPPPNPALNLLNISTRGRVEAGENAMIGGFIVQGQTAKKILVRGLGPSLPLTGALSNPILDLYDSAGTLVATNDDWKSDQLDILGTTLPPTSEREAAILVTLEPGAYTATVRDRSGQPGLALVEAYDLDPTSSVLANISTRGEVQEGDNAMIGGFIIGGGHYVRVLVRAIGPSLSTQGVAQPLADPVLEVHDSSGRVIGANDDWQSTQKSEITATGLAPVGDKESAIVLTLSSDSYTAIVRGQNGTTGVGLVEVYDLGVVTTDLK